MSRAKSSEVFSLYGASDWSDGRSNGHLPHGYSGGLAREGVKHYASELQETR
jgi:hypothetical protein